MNWELYFYGAMWGSGMSEYVRDVNMFKDEYSKLNWLVMNFDVIKINCGLANCP